MSSAKSATSICRMKRWASSRGTPRLTSLRKHSARQSAASRVTFSRSFSKVGLGEPGARNASGPQRPRQILQRERVFGRVEVGIKIVNAELVKIAEHDIARAIRGQGESNNRKPGGSASADSRRASSFRSARRVSRHNRRRPCRRRLRRLCGCEIRLCRPHRAAGLAEGLKKAVEEDLRLALFVAGDVLLTPCGEFC